MSTLPPYAPPSAWGAAAPATGAEVLWGRDANGNPAAMPLSALRAPGRILLDPTLLARWRRARARTQLGAGAIAPKRARILCIGDSTTAGFGAGNGSSVGTATATAAKARSWPSRLAVALSAAGVTALEQSFFSDNQVLTTNSVQPSVYDPRLAFSASVGQSSGTWKTSTAPVAAGNATIGGGFYLTNTNGAYLTFTPTVPFDTAELYTANTSTTGTMTGQVGSASAVSVNTNSASSAIGHSIFSGTLGAQALTLTNTSTSYFAPIGCLCYAAGVPGVDVINAGRCGGMAADNQGASFTNPWNELNLIPAIAPDLTIINHGINEWRTAGYSVATFKAAVQAKITAALQTGDVVLVVPIPSQTTGTYGSVPVSQQQPFQQALYQLAQSNNIPLLDMTYVLGGGANAAALGLMADQLHGLDTLYQDEAQQVANLLMAA